MRIISGRPSAASRRDARCFVRKTYLDLPFRSIWCPPKSTIFTSKSPFFTPKSAIEVACKVYNHLRFSSREKSRYFPSSPTMLRFTRFSAQKVKMERVPSTDGARSSGRCGVLREHQEHACRDEAKNHVKENSRRQTTIKKKPDGKHRAYIQAAARIDSGPPV